MTRPKIINSIWYNLGCSREKKQSLITYTVSLQYRTLYTDHECLLARSYTITNHFGLGFGIDLGSDLIAFLLLILLLKTHHQSLRYINSERKRVDYSN